MRKTTRARLAALERHVQALEKELESIQVWRIQPLNPRLRALELELEYPDQCVWAKAKKDTELKLALPVLTGDYYCPDNMITIGERDGLRIKLEELLRYGKKKGWIR